MRVKQLSAAQARARGNRPVLPVICHAATRIRFLPAASATPRSTTVPRMIRHSLHRRSDKRFGILDREILSQEIESLDIGRLGQQVAAGDRPLLQGFASQAIFLQGLQKIAGRTLQVEKRNVQAMMARAPFGAEPLTP